MPEDIMHVDSRSKNLALINKILRKMTKLWNTILFYAGWETCISARL